MNLPHRRFVFTVPKALRPYFRHDRTFFAEVSRLIFAIIHDFYSKAAGRKLLTGIVVAHQTFGDMLRWNPHYHTIVLEGGFDHDGTFFYIPIGNLASMIEVFRRRVIVLLLDRRLLDARPPISLKKIRYEPFKGRVLFHTTCSEYFKENVHLFDALDFLAELTQHLPPKGVRLIRRYGLYSSRTKGRWLKMPYVTEWAPAGWRKIHVESEQNTSSVNTYEEVELTQQNHAGTQLIAKFYEVDPFVCPKCGHDMKVVAVIEAHAGFVVSFVIWSKPGDRLQVLVFPL